MTYASVEASTDGGLPVELYEFRLGTNVWRYTSGPLTINKGGYNYTPVALSRSATEEASEIEKATLKIKVAPDNGVAELFINGAPPDIVTVTIFGDHYGESDWQTVWKGRVVNASFSDAGAELGCESILASLRRPGLRRTWQVSCPHTLYGTACGVNKASHKQTLTVDTVTANTITFTAGSPPAVGYFAGGFIVYTNNLTSVVTKLLVIDSTETTVVTATAIAGLDALDPFDVYPGCNKTIAICGSKFSNTNRYGGALHMPKNSNAFAGTRVF